MTPDRIVRSILASAGAAAFVVALSGAPVLSQSPSDSRWWPSEWGAADERGASHRITPDRVLEAARLIQEGKIYSLGRLYEPGMPSFGNRHYSLTIPGLPTGGPFGENDLVYNDELFSGEIGQVGTQFDGLGHVGTRIDGKDVFYNGFELSEFGTAYGLERLGVEKAGPFFTRGVLLDVAAYKGVERLDPRYIITVEDIEGTLARRGHRDPRGRRRALPHRPRQAVDEGQRGLRGVESRPRHHGHPLARREEDRHDRRRHQQRGGRARGEPRARLRRTPVAHEPTTVSTTSRTSTSRSSPRTASTSSPSSSPH